MLGITDVCAMSMRTFRIVGFPLRLHILCQRFIVSFGLLLLLQCCNVDTILSLLHKALFKLNRAEHVK